MSHKSNPGFRHPVFVAFWQGLTNPSAGALFITFGVLAGTFLLVCLILTPALMASGTWRYFMINDLDTQTYVTQKVLGRAASETPSIVLLGTSVMIRCVESEESLSDLIEGAGSGQFRVHDLATDGQTSWEMAALVERLPPGPGGVIVVGLNPGLLAMPQHDVGPDGSNLWTSLAAIVKRPKLGFTPTALDEEARRAGIDVPFRSGVYAIDNAGFFLSRRKELVRNLLRGGTNYADPLTAPWYAHVNRQEFWKREIAALPGIMANYDAYSAENFDVIARLIERTREQHLTRVIILESPVNPRWQDETEGALFHARYRADLQAFATEQNASFLAASEAAALRAEDFVDYEGHIGNGPARRRCTEALAEGVTHELRRDI